METQLTIKILIFLSLSVVASFAPLSATIQTYWNSKFPDTPMPQAIKDSLPQGTGVIFGHGSKVGVGNIPAVGRGTGSIKRTAPFFYYDGIADEEELHDNPIVSLHFKSTTLHQGSTMNLEFPKTRNTAVFLPHEQAKKIPFSSQKITQIFEQFSLTPNSEEAQVMNQTIRFCEEPAIKGEEKHCATSLKAMVDFVISLLGKNVGVLATDHDKNTTLSKQNYTIFDIKKMNNKEEKAVVCHKVEYAYAVFNCHHIPKTEAYMVSIVGANGVRLKAAAVCHKDTLAFNPQNFAFKVLKIQPGTVPVCHFLPQGHIGWVAN